MTMTTNNLPPKNISAGELFTKLSAQPRAVIIANFPRTDAEGKPLGQVAIRPLTQAEQAQCEIAAGQAIRQIRLQHAATSGTRDKSEGYSPDEFKVFATLICVEQLFRACRDIDDHERPAFPSPGAMTKAFTTGEIAALYELFGDACEEIGPAIHTMGPEEHAAWTERLIEGGNAAGSLPFGLQTWRALALSMAAELRISRTVKSSVGSPPGATATDDEQSSNDLQVQPMDLSDLGLVPGSGAA